MKKKKKGKRGKEGKRREKKKRKEKKGKRGEGKLLCLQCISFLFESKGFRSFFKPLEFPSSLLLFLCLWIEFLD